MTSYAGTGPFAGMSIATLAERLRAGHAKARTLAEQALTAADDIGAALNCFVTVDHDGAMRAAEQADRELASGVDRGPLHGIPVGVKDLVDTAGLRTTYGSRHFADHVPTVDAEVVVALRQAGAVIVGKTHTHQFAYGPTGDVAATGPCRNPLDTGRMSGGSSAGSGAAIAAGIVPAALGTDTGGSVRIPAALCGIVGLRPTQGAVSSAGVFPLSATLDMVGPMAASVADTAVLWSALAHKEVRDVPVDDLRIGVARPDRVVAAQLDALDQAVVGFVTRDVPMPDLAQVYTHIQGPEAYAVHAERVERTAELFAPEVLRRLSGAGDVRAWEYVTARRTRERLRDGFFDRLGVDVIALPTVPIEAPPIGARGVELGAGWTDPARALLSFNVAWSVLGLPAISIPVPDKGMPGSVQFVGRPGAEDVVLRLAALVESRLR